LRIGGKKDQVDAPELKTTPRKKKIRGKKKKTTQISFSTRKRKREGNRTRGERLKKNGCSGYSNYLVLKRGGLPIGNSIHTQTMEEEGVVIREKRKKKIKKMRALFPQSYPANGEEREIA